MKLVNEKLDAGPHEYSLNGTYLSSGTYFYILTTAEKTETKKMLLIK